MTDIPQTTPEVSATTGDLIRAAATFADAALLQFAALKPDDCRELTDAFGKGLAEMVVVVVGLNPGGRAAQLCADVGSKRHVLCTVSAEEITGARH